MIVEDFDCAIKCYELGLSINPKEFYGYWGLGNVNLKKHKNDKAYNYFLKASNLNPNCAILYTYIGLTLNN